MNTVSAGPGDMAVFELKCQKLLYKIFRQAREEGAENTASFIWHI